MVSTEPPGEDVSQEPTTAETLTPPKTEPPKEKITKAEAKPRPKPAEPTSTEKPKPTPTTAKKVTPIKPKPETKAPVKEVETVTTKPVETTPTPEKEPEKKETPVKTEPKPVEPKPEKKPEVKVPKPTPAADSGMKMTLPKAEQVEKVKTHQPREHVLLNHRKHVVGERWPDEKGDDRDGDDYHRDQGSHGAHPIEPLPTVMPAWGVGRVVRL